MTAQPNVAHGGINEYADGVRDGLTHWTVPGKADAANHAAASLEWLAAAIDSDNPDEGPPPSTSAPPAWAAAHGDEPEGLARSGLLEAAKAVFAAERAIRKAAATVDELGEMAASSLRVLDDVATDAFYAHQDDRREFYVESAGEHLGLLRSRSGAMRKAGAGLTASLDTASSALERAGQELDEAQPASGHRSAVAALRSQVEVLGEVVHLAGPVAAQITRHIAAGEASAATDSLALLDTRVHEVSREVNRADEGVTMMRAVMDTAQSTARKSLSIAGDISYAATHPNPAVAPTSTRPESRPAPGMAS